MAALQGAFHAEYSCLCAAEREESLCRGTKGNLAGDVYKRQLYIYVYTIRETAEGE